MTRRFAALGYTAWLRSRPGGRHEVVATKGVVKPRPSRVWLNVVLFLATLLTVLYIGARYALADARVLTNNSPPVDVLLMPLTHLYWGLPFAGTLMGILLAHELSHYFVARRYGSPLIVAIPLLILGLALSSVGPPPPDVKVALQEGNSLLYLALKYLMFGKILPSNGVDVWLHPVAFAAWAGLLVTMINLIPVGQLDGGHVSYALLGRRAWTLGYVLIVAMIAWGGILMMLGNGAGGFWLTWGFLNLLLNARHPPPLDDATKPDWRRVALGLLVFPCRSIRGVLPSAYPLSSAAPDKTVNKHMRSTQ